MQSVKVELLIILRQDDRFCDNVKSLKKFISVDDDLSVTGDEIFLKSKNKSESFSIKITSELIEGKKERYFKIKIEDVSGKRKTQLNVLIRKIKKIVNRINPGNINIHILWDDIGRDYALKSYPLINEVENLMRKLLTQFLLINVGMDWSETAIHNEIQQKIKHQSTNLQHHSKDLYSTDFIHLSDVLFKKYRSITLTDLDNLLANAEKAEDLDITEVKKILPLSNWERYFSKVIKYDESKLKEQWKQLYNLRNDIAHNRFIDRTTHEKIKKLHSDLVALLNQTIEQLNNIEIKSEDKVEILQTYNATTTKRLIKVAKEWNVATSTIVEFLHEFGYNVVNKPIQKISPEMQELIYKEFSRDKSKDILHDPGPPPPLPLSAFKNIEIIKKRSNIEFDDK